MMANNNSNTIDLKDKGDANLQQKTQQKQSNRPTLVALNNSNSSDVQQQQQIAQLVYTQQTVRNKAVAQQNRNITIVNDRKNTILR